MADTLILDPRANQLFVSGEGLVRIATGCVWNEGPVWLHEDLSLLWSDIPNNRMMRWSARDGTSVWRDTVDFTNGHSRDLTGAVLHCSHGQRAIVRTSFDADMRPVRDDILVDRHDGARLNSPNDIVVKSDGTIWFTDPPYGIRSDREGHMAPSELAGNFVFRFDPASGELAIVTDFMDEPNGLAFSPDETILYVSDTSSVTRPDGHHHIVAFDVEQGRSLANPRVFAVISPGVPDGFRVDRNGWIYSSSDDGIHIYHQDGTRIAFVAVPEKVGNLTFGGSDGDELFICASTSIYRIRLNSRGQG